VQNYLTHATTSTGHIRRSYRHEVADDVVSTLKCWLPDLLTGQLRCIVDDRYAARCDWYNGKAIGLVVCRLDAEMRQTDLVRFSVCRHSKRATPAWEYAGGEGSPPRVPFVAAGLLQDNIVAEDLPVLPVIGDFERCLAWAWLED